MEHNDFSTMAPLAAPIPARRLAGGFPASQGPVSAERVTVEGPQRLPRGRLSARDRLTIFNARLPSVLGVVARELLGVVVVILVVVVGWNSKGQCLGSDAS